MLSRWVLPYCLELPTGGSIWYRVCGYFILQHTVLSVHFSWLFWISGTPHVTNSCSCPGIWILWWCWSEPCSFPKNEGESWRLSIFLRWIGGVGCQPLCSLSVEIHFIIIQYLELFSFPWLLPDRHIDIFHCRSFGRSGSWLLQIGKMQPSWIGNQIIIPISLTFIIYFSLRGIHTSLH